jgi:hypothetical protein
MDDTRHPVSPLWLRLLGGAVLALMASGLVYAVGFALMRFSKIGV